jgi:ribonuclease VapC
MFIDTSVIVALLANEPDAGDFADRISKATIRLTSGLVILEASMRLSSMLGINPMVIETRIRALLIEADISVTPIDERVASLSVAAFATYGKGRGHPAQLNLADCMSYACARAHDIPLLFKGNDFSKTDMTAA